jgi:tetratricopeptide (TPR) repeat protein
MCAYPFARLINSPGCQRSPRVSPSGWTGPRFVLALILLHLLCTAAWSQAPATTQARISEDTLIREGLQAYQSGQLDGAIAKFREANRIAPANPHARLYLGLLLYEKDPRSREAQWLMESVAERFPNLPDLHLRLLDSYLLSGNGTKVAPLLDRIRKPMEGNIRFRLNLIYTLVRYGQLAPARLELERVAARLRSQKTTGDESSSHDLAEVSFIEGMIAASEGKKEEAMRSLQEADRENFPPQNSPQMRMLAEALYRLEEFSLSAQAYQVYLDHFPGDGEARLQMAVALSSCSAFERALEQLRQVFEKSPLTPQVNYYLGLLLIELKKPEEARHHLQLELKSNPSSSEAMTQMAYLDYLQGENEKCLQWLAKARALNPQWGETYFVYGLLYNRMGKFDLAIKNLETVVKQAPKHIKAHYQLSIAYLRSGNEAKAKVHSDIYEELLAAHKAKSLGDDPRKK